MTVTSARFTDAWPEEEETVLSTQHTSARIAPTSHATQHEQQDATREEYDVILSLREEVAHRTSVFVVTLMLVVSYLLSRIRRLERHILLLSEPSRRPWW